MNRKLPNSFDGRGPENTPSDHLSLRVGQMFEASASGRLAIVVLLVVALGVIAGQLLT